MCFKVFGYRNKSKKHDISGIYFYYIVSLYMMLQCMASSTLNFVTNSTSVKLGSPATLTCQIRDYNQRFSAFLKCSFSKENVTSCYENCQMAEMIFLQDSKCTIMTNEYNMTSFIYSITASDIFVDINWSCEYHGGISNKAKIDIDDNPEVVNIETLPTPVKAGEDLLIQCYVKLYSSNSKYKIKWTKNWETLSQQLHNTKKDFNGNLVASIQLKNVTAADDGIYRCASDVASEKSVEVSVIHSPIKVVISSNQPKSVNKGTLVTFNCSSEGGYPEFRFRYFKTPLLGDLMDDQNKESEVGSQYTLKPSDNMFQFYCLAKNQYFAKRSQLIRFEIFYPPTILQHYENPAKMVREAREIILTCITTASKPAGQFTWERVKKLSSGSYVQLPIPKQNSDVISYINHEPSGEVIKSVYRFDAHRSWNTDEIRCLLYYNNSFVERAAFILNITFTPASVVLQPSTNGIIAGHVVNLICNVSESNPAVDIYWMKESQQHKTDVTNIAQYKSDLGMNNGFVVSSQISITNTSQSNNGDIYVCEVRQNSLRFEINEKFQLQIYYPLNSAVAFNPPNPRELDFVKVTCKTFGGHPNNSLSYKWTFKSQAPTFVRPLDKSSVVVAAHPVRLDMHTGAFFTIRRVSIDDIGEYTCAVESIVGGMSSASSKLLISFSPKLDAIIPSTVSAKINAAAASIITRFMSFPAISRVTWYKVIKDPYNPITVLKYVKVGDSPAMSIGRQSVTYSGRYMLTSLLTEFNISEFQLQIRNVQHDDFSDYRCELQHIIKTTYFEFHLVAEESKDVTIDGLVAKVNGPRACIEYNSNQEGSIINRYSHLVVRACLSGVLFSPMTCADHQVSDPRRGHFCFVLEKPYEQYVFRLLGYDGSQLLLESAMFQDTKEPSTRRVSLELVIGVSIGSVAVIIFLSAIAFICCYAQKRLIRKKAAEASITGINTTISTVSTNQSAIPSQRGKYILIPADDIHSEIMPRHLYPKCYYSSMSYQGSDGLSLSSLKHGSVRSVPIPLVYVRYPIHGHQGSNNKLKFDEKEAALKINTESCQPPDVTITNDNMIPKRTNNNNLHLLQHRSSARLRQHPNYSHLLMTSGDHNLLVHHQCDVNSITHDHNSNLPSPMMTSSHCGSINSATGSASFDGSEQALQDQYQITALIQQQKMARCAQNNVTPRISTRALADYSQCIDAKQHILSTFSPANASFVTTHHQPSETTQKSNHIVLTSTNKLDNNNCAVNNITSAIEEHSQIIDQAV